MLGALFSVLKTKRLNRMYISFAELLINIGAFIVLMIPVYFSRMTKRERWTTVIVGIIILAGSIWNAENNSEEQDALVDSITSIRKTVISIPDSIAIANKSIAELGIKIDEATGIMYVIDSQLAKKKFIQIIQNNVFPIGNTSTIEDKKKLNKAFDDLTKGQDYEKQIALDYIIHNFPEKATDYQINQIRAYYPYLRGNLNSLAHQDIFGQLNRMLINQGKHPLIIRYFKDNLIDVGSNKLAWDYLFKYDKNITLDFIDSTFKNHNPIFRRYGDVLRFSIGVNNDICTQLLNSRKFVDLVMGNSNKEDLRSIIWNLDYGKKEHSASLDYTKSYFYEQYLTHK